MISSKCPNPCSLTLANAREMQCARLKTGMMMLSRGMVYEFL
jgi:hypothetical protein